MNAIQKRLLSLMGMQLDINEHLGLLRGLACDPNVHRIAEIGFRTGISATALASAGKPLVCYDINPCSVAVDKLRKIASNFSFKHANSLKVKLESCDLLHIDSLHTYDHLLAELRAHKGSVTRWIALHDTTTFGKRGKDGTVPGLQHAIDEFLDEEKGKWERQLELTNNNGLTLLRRAF